jgi:hypothetical protein
MTQRQEITEQRRDWIMLVILAGEQRRNVSSLSDLTNEVENIVNLTQFCVYLNEASVFS